MALARRNDTHVHRSPGTVRARQRVAVQRAAQQRAQARRRWLTSIAAVGAVLAIVAGFVAVKLTTGTAAAATESPAPQNVVSQVTMVPGAVLAQVRGGRTVTPLQAWWARREELTW